MEDRYSGFGLAKYLGANIDLSDVILSFLSSAHFQN